MEGNISKVKTDYHDFDEYFSSNVIEATRKDPKQRIALFANNLTRQEYKRKIIESILCDRECCKVVSQGENKSNIELINKYLCNDDADSRKNAAGIIRNIFSEENIGTVLKSYWFVQDLPSLLEAIGKNESLKDEARRIIRSIFSEENIGTALKSYWFVYDLPSLLKAIGKNESLKDEARGIIRSIFSKGNIGTVLKSYWFVINLSSSLKDMIKNESLKDEARDIIRNIFSKENIGTVLESKIFMDNLPTLLKAMIENKSFGNEVKYIIKNISSYKNLGSILDRIGTSLGRSVPRDIVKGLAKEMLEKEYKDFENKATNFIGKHTSTKGASSMFEEMSDYRNKTEDSASDFIRNILGNNSVPEELKSELKDLSNDFLGEKRKFPADTLIGKEEKTRNRKLAVFMRE